MIKRNQNYAIGEHIDDTPDQLSNILKMFPNAYKALFHQPSKYYFEIEMVEWFTILSQPTFKVICFIPTLLNLWSELIDKDNDLHRQKFVGGYKTNEGYRQEEEAQVDYNRRGLICDDKYSKPKDWKWELGYSTVKELCKIVPEQINDRVRFDQDRVDLFQFLIKNGWMSKRDVKRFRLVFKLIFSFESRIDFMDISNLCDHPPKRTLRLLTNLDPYSL